MEAPCGFGVATEIVQHKAEHPGEILRRFGQQPAALGLGQLQEFFGQTRELAQSGPDAAALAERVLAEVLVFVRGRQ